MIAAEVRRIGSMAPVSYVSTATRLLQHIINGLMTTSVRVCYAGFTQAGVKLTSQIVYQNVCVFTSYCGSPLIHGATWYGRDRGCRYHHAALASKSDAVIRRVRSGPTQQR